MKGAVKIFFRINLLLSHPPFLPPPIAPVGSETVSEVAVAGLWEYIAVRCLTGWTGWNLDVKISNYEKPKPTLETSNPCNEFIFLCEHKLNFNYDICI